MSWSSIFSKGVSSFQISEIEQALSYFNQAIELGANHYNVYDSRAAAYEKLGRPKEALLDAKKVIDLAPNKYQGYARSARLFLRATRFKQASAMVDLALERLRPNDARKRVELAALKQQILDAETAHTLKTAYHFGKLPVEIIATIFSSVVYSNSAAVVLLSAVCRHWRSAAINTASLWRTLCLSNRSPGRKFKTWMERSKKQIRNLYIRREVDAQHLSGLRWDKLRVCVVPHTILMTLLPWMRSLGPGMGAFEDLEDFVLDPPTFAEMGLKPFEQLCRILGRCKNLRRLTLPVRVLEGSVIATHITTLKTLTLSMMLTRGGDSFTAVLKANPELEELHLADSGTNTTFILISVEEPFPLIHLKRISITGRIAPAKLFQIAHMPSLESVSLDGIVGGAETVLQSMLQSEGDLRLTELSVTKVHFSPSTMLAILDRAPELKVLRINDIHGVANEILEALARPIPVHADGAPYPILSRCLKHVDFSRCPDIKTGPLVRLVKQRNTISAEERDASGIAMITSLSVDGCPQVESDCHPWLRTMVRRFSCVYMTKREAQSRR
ncbi:hypothetical protein PLICRDRAFT_29633 [Plicaturopsis crispa FD-325 SS-3]|nr:hypothetical protein PLICRDRAFT_29633 [Plicaturopsis crispa FD-325 SS-3]